MSECFHTRCVHVYTFMHMGFQGVELAGGMIGLEERRTGKRGCSFALSALVWSGAV